MLNSTVFYLLGWAIGCLTVLMFVACITAVGLGEWPQAGILLVNACVSGFISGALIIGFRGRPERLSRYHTSMLLLLVWIVLPIVAAFPLYALGGFGSPDQALFEAVSGLTTTGATVLEDLTGISATVILWRAMLQWFGGAVTLLTAVLVLAPFGILSTPMNITIPGYERDDLVKSVVATTRHILPTYLLLTLSCIILLWMTGIPTFDAVCLSFAAISTGGFMPAGGNISAYGSVFCELILTFFMLAGATSFLAHRAVMLRVAGTHSDNKETWYLAFVILIAGSALTTILGVADTPGQGWQAIRTGFFRGVSLVTTTGFDNATAPSSGVPFALVLALCSIGGAGFSTAGGLKVFRVFSMIAQAHRELKRLIHPRGITKAQSTGKPIDVQIMKPIWSLFFVFVLSMAVVSIVLGAEGVPVEQAVIAAVSSLTNTGPALEMTALDVTDTSVGFYGSLSTFPLLTVAAAMILGRIEFVVLLGLALMIATRR